MSEVQVRRVLSPAQVATRDKLVAAALRLATEHGYDGFGMRDVAAAAGVSPATAYHYFASKDHVLAEALSEWADVLTERLEAHPPAGATVEERVIDVLRRASEGVRQAPKLAAASTLAFMSRDPSAGAARAGVDDAMRRWLEIAIGDEQLPDFEGVAEVLELAFYSLMVSHASGRRTPDELAAALERVARTVLA